MSKGETLLEQIRNDLGDIPKQRRGDYDPGMCDIVIGLGILGFPKRAIATKLIISPCTLSAWEQKYPEFREAMRIAMEFAEGRHMIRGLELDGEPIKNTGAWTFTMKQTKAFSWTDRQDINAQVAASEMTPEQIDARLKELIAGLDLDDLK